MSESDYESGSETDSEQKALENNLRKTADIFEKSLATVDKIIAELQSLSGKLASIETHSAPVQKEMFRGKYEIRKTIKQLSVKEGDTITYKELVGRIISWIDAEGMETGGIIKPTADFSAAFCLKKATVRFPEVLGRLKKIVC
jgi:hypothetical protein